MTKSNITETLARVKELFEPGNKVLSCSTMRKKLNKNNQLDTTLTYKQVYTLLKNNRDIFTRAAPIEVGSNRWFDAKIFDKTSYNKSDKEDPLPGFKFPWKSNLWRLVK